jgi:peptidoglycan-N-acetylglucosamine deacetylase
MFQLFRPPRWIDRFYPAYTWRFFISRPSVFLTFDDGPHPAITPFVLEELAKHDMKATFFCVGENMKRYPEIIEAILAQGHRIGNHTMRHTKGSAVSDEVYFDSVSDFQEVYRTTLFRPPYGKAKRSQRKRLSEQFELIMWSWLSYDYDRRVPVERILRKAKSIRSGDIIVLHDNPKIADRQRELLPRLLDLLDEKGLGSEGIGS